MDEGTNLLFFWLFWTVGKNYCKIGNLSPINLALDTT
jgi:hypothetical protein